MATVVKDFKIKSGLIVEGTNGTINNFDILTKKQADQDYIVGLIGGTATSENTPDTVVKRDLNGNFAAGTVTVNRVNIGSVGYIEDDGSIEIVNTDGDDINLRADDIRLTAEDDVLLTAGDLGDAGGDVVLTTNGGKIRLQSGDVFVGTDSNFPDSDRVATQGYVDTQISNIDLTYTTDDVTEGTNLYYTDARVDSHLSGTYPIEYNAGDISIALGEGGGLTTDEGGLYINRTTVDAWYDANGAAGDVATDLSTHETATTGIHGVTGNVVGTSDIQTLSNKTIDGTLEFGLNGSDISDTDGDLTIDASGDLHLESNSGDVILNADGSVYVGSATAGNEVATHSYVDNAVSGLAWKQAVNLKVDTEINTAGDQVGAVFDGHGALELADAGYRFLVVGQVTDTSTNGIWEAFADGAALYFRRPTDADAYSELIGSAVYVMEGTQYGGTSWVQGNHYLTDFTGQTWTQFSGQGSVTAGDGIVVDGLQVSVDFTVVAELEDLTTGLGLKQDVLTAGSNIDISGATISVTGLTSAEISDFNAAALSATASAYDAAGLAQTAETNAIAHANALDTDDIEEGVNNLYFTNQRAIDAVGGTITDQIDLLDTDDIEEGSSNLYFTDSRAKDAAAVLLTGASLTNITITGDGSGLTITAENGVADSTTDDLAEGEENLYFTDERAIDAVSNADIYPNAVIIDNVAKQVASQLVAETAGIQVGHAWAKADYRSAEFLVKVAYGTHTEISKVLVTLDTSDNIAITEYGIVGTNGSASSISAGISGTDVQLLVTTANNNSTVTVVGTLLV